jgi:hypothetical protein
MEVLLMKSKLHLLIGGWIGWMCSSAWGLPITFVDATPDTGPSTGNTKIVDSVSGLPVTMVPEPTSGFNYTVATNSGTDGFWQYRNLTGVNLVNGSNLWQTDAAGTVPNGESTQSLVTTITGLTPGEQYNLYVMFWGGQTATGNNWDVAARVGDTGQYTVFKHRTTPVPNLTGYIDGGLGIDTTATGTEFTNAAPSVITRAFSGTQSHLLYGSLGTVTISGSGAVSIYVQGPDVDPASSTSERRTYYEGVGYEIVPEPQSFLLISLGSLVALGRHWRKSRV